MARKMIILLMCAVYCSLPAPVARADGAVYAMTNALGNNQILVYHRASDGNLNPTTPIQTIATGGGGSGLPEGSDPGLNEFPTMGGEVCGDPSEAFGQGRHSGPPGRSPQ